MKERRRAVRLEKILEAVQRGENSRRIFITDLSVTGLRGYTRNRVRMDEMLRLVLTLGDLVEDDEGLVRTGERVELEAEVVWFQVGKTTRSYAMGAKFVNLSEEATEKLEKFVLECLEAGQEEGDLEQPEESAEEG